MKKIINDLIYPELSYKIIGILFEIFRQFGSGYQEKHYQKIIAIELKSAGLKFKKELPAKIKYKGEIVGKYFFDFLIDDKIILEVKKNNIYSKKHIEQVYGYLKTTNLKLGIIANFTKEGVKFKRILNIK